MIKITAIRFKTLQVSLISLGEYIYIYIYNTTRKYEETKIFLKKKRYYIPRVPLACPSTNSL